MPYGRIIPGPKISFLVWEVPDSDVASSTFMSIYSKEPIDKAFILQLLGLDDERYWSEDDPSFKGSWENGFFQDRAAMGSNFTGFRGIEIEDAAIGVSYGPIYDRSLEHLVTADMAVVRVRRRLMECLRLQKEGEAPLGLTIEDMRTVAAPDTDVPVDTDWRDLAPMHRTTLVAAE
jgi:phthalate 4,5-dioxygenase oxygenase subunit